jgi:hydrogenase maturation protease
MSRETEKQILVAGIGNTWLRDDGFGSEVVKRLAARELPPGVTVMDFGIGGLDLAYEVMRGYDSLILIDVSRQGGEPGTLYLMEADEDEVSGGIEDGAMLDPHGMDPATVLRFVKAVGGWPGKVIVIACEPEDVDDVGIGLTADVTEAVDRAVELVLTAIGEVQTEAVPAG